MFHFLQWIMYGQFCLRLDIFTVCVALVYVCVKNKVKLSCDRLNSKHSCKLGKELSTDQILNTTTKNRRYSRNAFNTPSLEQKKCLENVKGLSQTFLTSAPIIPLMPSYPNVLLRSESMSRINFYSPKKQNKPRQIHTVLPNTPPLL